MTRSCEVCAGHLTKKLFIKHGYTFMRCEKCCHIFVDLDIPETELFRLYETNFFSKGGYADYLGDKAIHQKNFAKHVSIIRRYSPGGLLFEVGCAYGFFLEVARSQWQVSGVDINPEATAFARNRLGLDVWCADLLELSLESEKYDVVTMWDTIEHLRNPCAYVARIAKMLRPGGILALTTGDVASLMARFRGRRWRLYYPPFHLHFFSRSTITLLLGRCGLSVVEIGAIGFYRSIDMILHRVFFDKKPPLSRNLYRVAKWMGVTRFSLYLNLFDIMLVIARKL